MDPNLLLEFVLQRQQQQKDTTKATIEQKPTLPIKERLGPRTPPPPYTEANIEQQVKEWLKLGIVQPTRSRYNSPMFLVNKKDGGFRVVQDFRALNSNM